VLASVSFVGLAVVEAPEEAPGQTAGTAFHANLPLRFSGGGLGRGQRTDCVGITFSGIEGETEERSGGMRRWSDLLVLVTFVALSWDLSYWQVVAPGTPGFHGIHWRTVVLLVLSVAAFALHLSHRRRARRRWRRY
jgi:hypothetical protein